MAEVDGNRTRRAGIACPDRFEGGGAHQAHGHLRPRTLPPGDRLRGMKRLILLLALIGLVAVAVKKVQSA